MDEKKEPISYIDAISKAVNAIRRFPLIEVQGVPLMNWIANSWNLISAFEPDPSDLLIATYPKAGKESKKGQSFLKVVELEFKI